jgi:excisionase family DNA binding protein
MSVTETGSTPVRRYGRRPKKPIPASELSGGLAYAPEDAARAVGVSRATIFELMRDDVLPRVKIGRRTLIRRVDLEAWLENSVIRT